MADFKIGGTPTYTIPLDSLDLAYLSKYVRTTGVEKMPLWTKKWLDGESEYCQVQIHNQRDHNDDCFSEPSDSYKCHICNILVPTQCSQKHNSSERHETSKKLYQKVLENLSNQMDISTINKDQDVDKDVYYCEPCSKIIKIKNKEKHENSGHHAKSVKDLSTINDFFKILKENNSYIDTNENLLGEDIDLKSDYFKANYFDDSEDDNGKHCTIIFDSDDDFLDHNPSVTTENSIVTNNQPLKENKKEDFEEYLKEMIKKYNLRVNLPIIDGDSISIVAPNGESVKVSREHFHSYRDVMNSVYCQLCTVWMSQDTRPHDVSEHHVMNIFRPVNDKFARLVDKISSHCVPCNEIVPTNSSHDSLNDNHKTIIKNTLTHKKEIKNDITLNENKVPISVKPGSGVNTASSGSTTKINDSVVSSSSLASTRSSCSNGPDHEDEKINAYYKLLQFTDKSKTKARCKICSVNIVFVERNIIEHMEGRNHNENANKQKMEKYNKLLIYTDVKKKKVYCKICDVNVPYVEKNIIEHMEGRNHELVETELLEFHSVTKESSGFVCKYCDIRMIDYLDHINSETHTLQIQEKYEVD